MSTIWYNWGIGRYGIVNFPLYSITPWGEIVKIGNIPIAVPFEEWYGTPYLAERREEQKLDFRIYVTVRLGRVIPVGLGSFRVAYRGSSRFLSARAFIDYPQRSSGGHRGLY